MRKIASRMPRRVPARRSAANDDPYSTSRCSPRWYQTRCGISCTSGYAPVTSDERQTGVSDGNTVAARRYSPRSCSSASAGAVRRSTASSYIAGVSPSMTISSALVAGKDPETGVALACAPADAEPEHGQREREEVAEHRNERERTRARAPRRRRAAPCRRGCRRGPAHRERSAPHRRCRARRRPRRRPRPANSASSQPTAAAATRATGSATLRSRRTPTARTPSAAPRPAQTPIQYQVPKTRFECTDRV